MMLCALINRLNITLHLKDLEEQAENRLTPVCRLIRKELVNNIFRSSVHTHKTHLNILFHCLALLSASQALQVQELVF